jgi:prepilin-type N-terminal cleavage/methylation domain-containing protein
VILVSRTFTVSQRGFTLVEMAVSVTIMAVVLVAIGLSTRSMSNAYSEGALAEDISAQAHLALEEIVEPLGWADRDALAPDPTPPLGSETLTFQLPTGFDAGGLTWGTSETIAWQLEDGELDDGADNNGNGLADEGVVVRTYDVGGANERSVVVTHWVRELLAGEIDNGLDDNANGLEDEPGLCFESNGDVITVRLSLERMDAMGRLLTKTVETAVSVRN